MDIQVMLSDLQRVNVIDRLVLSSLEFGFVPFESIEKLLNDESFISKDWFPALSFAPQRIVTSLLRLIRKRLIVCRPDSRIDGPIIVSPDRAQVPAYWFSPTSAGEAILTHTAPWDLEPGQCQLPNERATTGQLIKEFREDPEPWDYLILSEAQDPNRVLMGWTSYRAILVREESEAIATHVVEITQSRPLKALQAHFRPLGHHNGASDEPTRKINDRLTLLDLFLLDNLKVDIESMSLIAHILNNGASPYSEWLSGRVSFLRDIRKSAYRLVDGGYAVSYRESNGELELETHMRRRVDQSELWLGITPKGVQALNQQWVSAFSKSTASK